MGINTTTNSAVNSSVLGVSGGVTAGDLVSNNETGYLTKASGVLGVSFENNTTAGPAVIRAVTSIESDVDYETGGLVPFRKMCELGNGNIALVYAGDGTTVATGVNLRIRSVLGVDLISKVTLTSDTSVTYVRAVKISSTQFVVAWATSVTLKFMVINNDGTTAVAATTVGTTIGATASWNVGALASGDFVFAYDKVTSRDCRFSRYNAAGVLQGSETTVEATSTPTFIVVRGLTGGDYIVYYYRSAATTAYKFARYSASGVIVGALVTIIATSSLLNNGDIDGQVFELTGGNVVMAAASSGSTYPDIYVYSSSNTLVKFIDLGTVQWIAAECPSICVSGTGFAVFGNNPASSKTSFVVFDSSGNTVINRASVGNIATTTSASSGVIAFSLGSQGYAFVRVSFETSGFTSVGSLCVITPAGATIGTDVLWRTSGTDAISGLAAILTSAGTLAFSYKDAGSSFLSDGYYNVSRKSILGVAAETKALGQTVRVLTNGTYPINQSFGAGGNFDTTTATVSGSKGSVIGSTAVLRGTR